MSLCPLDGLHDAWIDRVWTEGGTTFIAIDSFCWSPTEGNSPPSLLSIVGTQQITANDVMEDAMRPLPGDGEINQLDQLPNGVKLLVFWHIYQPHQTEFVVYHFAGATAHLTERALDTPGVIG